MCDEYAITYQDAHGAPVVLVFAADNPVDALRSALEEGPEAAANTTFAVRRALATDDELAELVDVAAAVARAHRAGLGRLGGEQDTGKD